MNTYAAVTIHELPGGTSCPGTGAFFGLIEYLIATKAIVAVIKKTIDEVKE